MVYVEFLRVRMALLTYAIVIAIGAAFATSSIGHATGNHVPRSASADRHERSIAFGLDVNGRNGGNRMKGNGHRSGIIVDRSGKVEAHLTTLLVLGSMFAVVFATIVGTSLNKENGRGGFAFTKPIGRVRLACSYMAVDLVAIAVSYAYVTVVAVTALTVLGYAGAIVADADTVASIGLGLGIAFMWYGLLQAATAMRVSSGGLFIGLSWPFFLLTLGLYSFSFFGPVFHGAIAAIDFFNPLAYYSHPVGPASDVSLLGFNDLTSIALTWTIGLLACAAATVEWTRVEV